ncbi:hypothetical protein LACR_2610 [Lactococcus cremoris subsp. cremoris SK11]|uniref:Uncharacterized protein n=1 Tax=Lactococcus lactis subsp. cremoris (strain SK11) TaxID=272622 RepID=Q02VK1_LACLS|nr:hypothetical protein LACR_2610 [Lactococcus cremoris subsp. cremoris SK11]
MIVMFFRLIPRDKNSKIKSKIPVENKKIKKD